jgi:PEP-CTERM motif
MSVIDISFTADTTSVVLGQPVTFTVDLTYNPAGLPPLPPNTMAFVSLDYEIYSDAGFTNQIFQSSALAVQSFTFTYPNLGTFHPHMSGLALFGEDGPQINCALCAGHESLFTAPLPITVSVPDPATWALLLLGFAVLAFASRRSHRKAQAQDGTLVNAA